MEDKKKDWKWVLHCEIEKKNVIVFEQFCSGDLFFLNTNTDR